jgi:hypothetical protein
MIGGTDVVIPATGDSASTLDACARILRWHWPHVTFEDAETGDKYAKYGDVPFGRVRELFAYRDKQAEAAWDTDHPDSPPNSMVYVILTPESPDSSRLVTVVLDNPDTPEMQEILESIRDMMRERIMSPAIEETYAEVA